ncbi:hypothetical protein EJB05_32628, partial [Eragrostis curvula]
MAEEENGKKLSGEETIAEFEQLTRDAAAVQRALLRRILSDNAAAEYLLELGLDGRTDPDSFRAVVPLATHENLEPYIARIAGGDASPVLTGKPVASISLSSGTTQGKRKYLPFNHDLFMMAMRVYQTSFAFRNSDLYITYNTCMQGVPRGGRQQIAAVHLRQQPVHDKRRADGHHGHHQPVPHRGIQAHDARHPVAVLQPRRGGLRPGLQRVADEVARKCAGLRDSSWYGLIAALWPNAKYVHSIVTGSMEHYVKKLRHYAGGLPLVAMDYGASEGMVAANTDPGLPPESATFTVHPGVAYFEFIPLNKVSSDYGTGAEAEPIGLTDVTVGQDYEVIMTTVAGLYRYRLGDVVKVTGFYNSTPKLKFVCRRNLMLSINIDKNSEQDLQLAVGRAAKILAAEKNLEVIDYTSHADVSSNPGHYIVFWELNGDDACDDDVLQRCCDELDRGFVDPGYVGSRKARAIGPLELQVLEKGTFRKVLRYYHSRGAPVNQFKLPRCVASSNSSVLQILSSNAVKVFFSTAMPEKAGKFNGEEVIAEFERLTRDAAAVQRETLRRILVENADVEYLQGLGLNGRTDPDSFRACVPLATHADLEPYIARIADGDTSAVLTSKPVTSISLSSGTTQGKRKYLLFNDELFKLTIHAYRTSFAYRNRAFPVDDGMALEFIYGSMPFTTKGGLTATTGTTNLYRHQDYEPRTRDIKPRCCSPDEVIFAGDFGEALYCHLLCGLLSAGEVRTVFAMFAHNLVLAFQTLERVWEELCDDIRRGAPSPARVTALAARNAVSALMPAPNAALADEVARKCAGLVGRSWRGVIPALWPNARYVHSIMTGSMEHYVRRIRHYAGGLPLVAMDYGASEGMVAPNVEPTVPPEHATFTVLPDVAYFEFVPLKMASDGGGGDGCYDEAEPVGLTDVTVGEHYEVVMTTFAGLYRYRLGDVVKVAGFYNATPKLKFVSRGKNLTLSINVDMNTERDVQLAVDGAAAKVLAAEKLEVVDYTSHADVSSNPGHYVVFWELSAEAYDDDDDVLQRCCDELDRGFMEAGYVSSRRTRGIGPLELRVLRRGAFQEVMRHYISLGAPVNQFKLPRCVARNNSGVLQILSGNTVKVFFSAAYD